MSTKEMERSALMAIKRLRLQKLRQGIPFMINSDILESDQCFLEFPDGIIKIAEAATKERDFLIVYEFSAAESNDLRKKLKLA
jgi:hypothetical protein